MITSWKRESHSEGLEPSTSGFGNQRSTNWTKSAININDIYNGNKSKLQDKFNFNLINESI